MTHRPLPEALAEIERLGLTAWELPIRGDGVHLGHLDPAELIKSPSLADVIYEQVGSFPGLTLIGAGFEIARASPLPREVEHFTACAKLLARLACPLVTVFVFDDGAAEMGVRYRALLEVAQRHGLALSVETHLHTATQHPAAAKMVAESLGCSLTLDHSHYVAQGYSPADLAPLLVHAKHIQIRGCGPGSVEAGVHSEEEKAEVLRTLQTIVPADYGGYVCIEYINRKADWSPSIRNIASLF